MKKTKVTSSQSNKISDFFSKIQTNNKRKAEEDILSSPTNLSDKTNVKTSPVCKKLKKDENSPDKMLKPSTSMKTPTPKKNKTPQSSKKFTPNKLFDKSPAKLNEFNIEILESFVNISPSTSNKIIKVKNGINSPRRPSSSQKNIETTPSKLKKKSSPVKTRLNFLEKIDNLIKKEQMEDVGIKQEVDYFEDDFDVMLSFDENFSTLDLTEPQHCSIIEVNNSNGKVDLKLKSNKDGNKGSCSVEEFWASGSHFAAGDNIFISAGKINNKYVVNNNKGWLVYEPDLLIPCTSVVGSLFCKRKGVLSDRFRGFDTNLRIIVIGVLTHTLLQQALKNQLKTSTEIQNLLSNILHSKDTIKKLYESSLTLEEVENEMQTFIPKVFTFINDYINCKIPQNDVGNWQGKIESIDDIEENLWCPELGIKGKIDVTVQTKSGLMPMELKTGRASVSLEHRGQVLLYLMMMKKFGYKVSSGLLLYLREGVLKEIKATEQEQRDIMIFRNELAYYLMRTTDGDILKPPELPEPINNYRACSKCPYNIICTSYLKFENHDLSQNKIQEVQKTVISHLSQKHLEYFMRWSNCLNMEAESDKMSKSVRQIYTIPAQKRESSGRCISNVKIVNVANEESGLYEHTFQKDVPNGNLMVFDIVENNYVVVSTDKRPAVACGFVTEVTTSKILILLDRNLESKYSDCLFHLDTYDSNNTFTFNMTSLALLLENTPRASELRDIIIDKKPPTFIPKLPSIVAKKGITILKRLNKVQQKAVLKALTANQFFLIKGMPGTGKSATIVALIQLLLELNKTVLVTSHTHSAIDNICIRLKNRGVDFLRLGSESKIDSQIKMNSEASLTKNCTSSQELDEVYNKYKVIAVTCLGSGHPLLSKRSVDVCIVDESTQVVQTSIIKPLYSAKTFVLIGDPDQLAPVVKNANARKAGMSESLFERLENPEATIALNLNYRMNKTLTNLANILTYKGELKPASDVIADRVLKIPNIEAVKSSFNSCPWLLKALDTSLERSVQIVNTGPVWQQPDIKWNLTNLKLTETYDNSNCVNIYEAAIVVTLVKALIEGGVPSCDIGVIATYRAQVSQLADLLDRLNVDVSTVDQFQGRDKPVIIYSCTKSTEAKVTTDPDKVELLEDKRRLTVAITRAKCKLLIVGDVSTLQRFTTFATILPHLENNIIEFDSSWTSMNNF